MTNSEDDNRSIIVKFMARQPLEFYKSQWPRQFPGNITQWGKCQFVFDDNAKEYDWLVIYHDIARRPDTTGIEQLQCPREKTILITTEPSTITVYGEDYLNQFGIILTSQEAWAIPHPDIIFSQPGLIWHYGMPFDAGEVISYDKMKATPPPAKTKTIATVCSIRKGTLTLHSKRVAFTKHLQADLPELDVFGHGVNPMSDKAEALDPYKYHITIENHIYPHHMTEKLPDAFLGYTLPFYHGCPNASNYFPRESFIPIDINDYDKTLDVIQSTIANNEYEDRLPYIIEARRRVLDEHNLFPLLNRIITERNNTPTTKETDAAIMTRQILRLKKPWVGVKNLFEKFIIKGRHRIHYKV